MAPTAGRPPSQRGEPSEHSRSRQALPPAPSVCHPSAAAPRPIFAVLQVWIGHQRQGLTREDMSQALWADEYRTDAASKVCRQQVRRVLGDSSREQRFIRTRHGYGYQFVAPVRVLPEACA